MQRITLVRFAIAGAMLVATPGVVLGEARLRPVLVELFTSEGCSSCPPADALLRAIDAKRTDSGQMVVGISEHVTYWNRLGWADPFSAELYTARQEAYRARFGLESAYTPQVVVNGEREVLGSDRGAVLKAVRDAGSGSTARGGPVTLRIGSAVVSGERVKVTYTTTGGIGLRGVDVYAVVAEDEVMSQVARGENSGRTLTHVSVARTLTKVGGGSDGERSVEIEAGGRGSNRGKEHVVLFAQRVGLGPIVAVDVAPVTAGDRAVSLRR